LIEDRQPTDEKEESPPKTVAKRKGKHVSFVEQAKEIAVEFSGPSTRASKSKLSYVQ